MLNLTLLSSLLLLCLFNSPSDCVKFKAIRIINQEGGASEPAQKNLTPARENQNQEDVKPIVKKKSSFFPGSRYKVTGSKPVFKSPSPPLARITKGASHPNVQVESEAVATGPIQSQFRRKIGQHSRRTNDPVREDLNTVAKTMKAAVVNRKVEQPAQRQQLFSGGLQGFKIGQHSGRRTNDQVRGDLNRVAKTMKAAVVNRKVEQPAHRQQQSSGGLQGFKVQGDDTNKIIFLDLDALRAAGLSLDDSAISLGSDNTGSSLQRIDGLKTANSISQTNVQQARRIDQDRSRVSSQPRVSIKHVDANQVVGRSHPAHTTNQKYVPSFRSSASAPKIQFEDSHQQPKLFFNKHQSTGKINNKSVVQKALSSPKSTSASFESLSHFPAVGKPQVNSNVRSGKSIEVNSQVADNQRTFNADEDSLQFLASLKSSNPTLSRPRSQPNQPPTLSRSEFQETLSRSRSQPISYQRSTEQRVLSVSQLLRSTTQPPTAYQDYTTQQQGYQDYQSYTSRPQQARQAPDSDHARQIQSVQREEEKIRALQRPETVLANKFQTVNVWDNQQQNDQNTDSLDQRTLELQQQQKAVADHARSVADVLRQEDALRSLHTQQQPQHQVQSHQQQQDAVLRLQQQFADDLNRQHQAAARDAQSQQQSALLLQHQHNDLKNLQHQIDARNALSRQHLTPHQRGLAQHQDAIDTLRRNQLQG